MKIKPITEKEKAWVKKAQALFDKCPPRFEFVTMGDPRLDVVDKDGARESELCDGAAARDGVVLATIRTKGTVHGVS